MKENKLVDFVEKSLAAGESKETIEKVLAESNWPRNQIKDALGTFSSTDFVIPVPKPKSQLSAREAFLYIVMFSMLYFSVYHFIQISFHLIDSSFPDPLNDEYSAYTIRRMIWSTSYLIATFPVFLFVSFRISKSIQGNLISRSSGVRKWLTYMTLSLAACVIVGDIAYIINSFLSGELTIRVVLKFFTVIVIACVVFYYYLWLMRTDDVELSK